MTRRDLLRALALLAPTGLAVPARGQERYAVGLIASPSGGEAVEAGAALGLDEGNALAGSFGKGLELVRETAAEAAAGAAGDRLVRDARVIALVGGETEAAARALRDVAARTGVLFFNVGTDADALREAVCHRHTFHVAASRAMYLDALARVVVGDRRLARWAVAAPDPSGAAVTAVRRAVARHGGALAAVEATDAGAVPALVARLEKAAADVVFAALPESTLAGFAREARAAGLGALLAGVGHPALSWEDATGVWVASWHPELERFSARELNARFRRRFGRPLSSLGWAAWAAVRMLAEAIVRAGTGDAAGLIRYFEGAPRFDGHKGEALTFRSWDHQLGQPLYILGPRKREPGSEQRDPLTVVAQMPPPGETLDAIGVGKGETTCRF